MGRDQGKARARVGLWACLGAFALWSLAWGCSEDTEPVASGQVQAPDADAGDDVGQDAGDVGQDAPKDDPDLGQDADAQDQEDGSAQDVAEEPDLGQDAADAQDEGDAPQDVAEEPDVVDEPDAVDEPEVDAGQTIAERCFPELAAGPGTANPSYDPFEPVVNSMCAGTNHQDIRGVTKVVFFGDSVTQGTPNDEHLLCVDNEHFYRNRLAEFLADHFGLDRGNGLDWAAWKTYSCQYNGEPGRVESGDFKNCSKWGARTDDLLGETSCGRYSGDERARCCEVCCHGGTCGDGGQCIRAAGSPETDAFCGRSNNKQVDQCVPQGQSPEVPLFVFTMGGNDIAAISQDGAQIDPNTPEGLAEVEAGYPSMWALAHRTIDYLEEALRFMKDPARFPNGSYVVFANPFEFTDGTGDVGACQPEVIEIPLTPDFSLRLDLTSYGIPLAELAGFGDWARPEVQQEIVVWILEQYMRLAVEFQVDLAWMLESFCGHGYVATGADADMSNRCYRADDPSRWFDVTCIHPNERGHTEIFKLFRALVLE